MIRFLKFTKLYFFLSAIVITIGLFSIFKYGFSYSIDFKGGSIVEYKFSKQVEIDEIERVFKKNNSQIDKIEKTGENAFLISTNPLGQDAEQTIQEDLANDTLKIERLRYETVGPSLGKETIRKTALASVVAGLGILLYMTFAFSKFTYGISALIAMLHDLLILLGMYSLLSHFTGAEVDVLFVTAVLTTMSFSVHDTIVVFDKIREHQRTKSLPVPVLADKALTETMVRSVNNSLTIVLMLVPLVVMGGDTIQYFAAALLIGTIAGTYSSPFVATPILGLLER